MKAKLEKKGKKHGRKGRYCLEDRGFIYSIRLWLVESDGEEEGKRGVREAGMSIRDASVMLTASSKQCGSSN